MSAVTVGLDDISIHVPQPQVELAELVRRRVQESPDQEKHLKRARETTGQRSFRFPAIWEDTTTLAAEATRKLLKKRSPAELASLRFLTVGTETSVDQSKPVAAYVQGILKRDGLAIPANIATFQVQHACAGGALAAISVGALLNINSDRNESGVVICSDVARYKTKTTAEITQGAGAVALHLSNRPALLELDLDTQGFNSSDVDDFFRPIGQATASVRGGYSMKCYIESFEAALGDHSRRRGEDPARVLESTDMFVLHAPFRNMPLLAMQKILATHLGMSPEDAEEFLAERGFFSGIDPVSRVGNTYTASLFFSLAFTLQDRFRRFGDEIVGKRVLLVSYGSGNTMAVISGRVAPGAPEVIQSWDLDNVWTSARPASQAEYDRWTNPPADPESYALVLNREQVPGDSVYLNSIREDGYRVYEVNKVAEVEVPEGVRVEAAVR